MFFKFKRFNSFLNVKLHFYRSDRKRSPKTRINNDDEEDEIEEPNDIKNEGLSGKNYFPHQHTINISIL